MSLVHTAVDFVAVLFHVGFVNIIFSEVFAGTASTFVFIMFLFAVKKSAFKMKILKEL